MWRCRLPTCWPLTSTAGIMCVWLKTLSLDDHSLLPMQEGWWEQTSCKTSTLSILIWAGVGWVECGEEVISSSNSPVEFKPPVYLSSPFLSSSFPFSPNYVLFLFIFLIFTPSSHPLPSLSPLPAFHWQLSAFVQAPNHPNGGWLAVLTITKQLKGWHAGNGLCVCVQEACWGRQGRWEQTGAQVDYVIWTTPGIQSLIANYSWLDQTNYTTLLLSYLDFIQ